MGGQITQPTISVLIFTYNAEREIRDCIQSAGLLSENIRVVDLESTDNTAEIAGQAGAIISSHSRPMYVELVRDFGIKNATSEWVFILDVDERMTRELADEVKQAVNNTSLTHYKVPRKNIFARVKWLSHGGWWPDYQIRLINTKYFRSWPKVIHSTPIIDGAIGYLHKPITHYFHSDIESMVKKTIVFENIESDLLYEAQRNVSTITFFRKFLGEFFRRFCKNVGFLDGTIGIIESIYQAYSKTITYLYLYEKKSGFGEQSSRTL